MHTSEVVEDTRRKVHEALDHIITDDAEGMFFFRADTGCGKTSGFIQALPRLLEDHRGVRIAIAVPTTKEVDAVYRAAVEVCDDTSVGVWTKDHQDGKYQYRSLDRWTEGQKPIFIGTHNNLLKDQKNTVGKRDLLIVDEIPSDIEVIPLEPQDFAAARTKANELGLRCALNLTIADQDMQDRQKKAELIKQGKYVPRRFTRVDQLEIAREEVEKLRPEDAEPILKVLDFLKACADGRAFERVQRFGKGHKVYEVYYKELQRRFPKKIVFSATSHLDGFQHSEYAHHLDKFAGARVMYSNLSIRTIPYPDIDKRPATIATDPQQVQVACNQLLWTISKTAGDRVLVVVPNPLQKWFEVSLQERQKDDPLDKEIMVTHWGCDVGSNDYRECSDVILWNNFHKPQHVTFGEYLLYSDQRTLHGTKTNKKAFKDVAGGRARGAVRELKDTQLYAAIKQMGNRGSVRMIKDDSTCGDMTLWLCWDELDLDQLEQVFPGSGVKAVTDLPKGFVARSRTKTVERMVQTLDELPERIDEITLEDVAYRMNIRPLTLKAKKPEIEKHGRVLQVHGWRFVKGKGGRYATPHTFQRLAA